MLGIAAALALLALLVPALGNLGDSRDGGDDATAADTFEETAGTPGAGKDAAGGGAELGDGGTAAESDPQARSLGAFDDLDALVGALGFDAAPPARSTSSSDARGSGDENQAGGCPTDFTEGTVAGFTATLAGEPVEVLVITGQDGARSVTVLHAGTCDLVASRAL